LGDGRNKFQIVTGYAGVGAVYRGLQGEIGSTRTSLSGGPSISRRSIIGPR